MTNLDELRTAFRALTEKHHWQKLQDPKNLTLALSGRIGAVASLLQWTPAAGAVAAATAEPLQSELRNELADVLVYLTALSDQLGFDVLDHAVQRIRSAVEAA